MAASSIPGVDPGNVISSSTNGTQTIQDELNDFQKYVAGKYGQPKASDLPRPFVYDAVHPAAGIDFGISDELVADQGDEVTVLIAAHSSFKPNSGVGLKWGNKTIWGSIQSGPYTSIKVKGNDIPEGEAELSYNLYPGSASGTVKTLYRKGQPGVKGVQGVGLDLPAPEITKPASGVIGPTEAKAKVKVTIQPWLSMNEHDELNLYWGDEEIVHVVTLAQLNKPIVIEVDESTIQAAGDSKALPVYYFVMDVVGNESEWSSDAFVEVKLTNSTLGAPVVLDPDGAVITTGDLDLANIQGDHAVVRVNEKLKVNDSVLLHWVGTSQQGQAITLDFGPLVVVNPCSPLDFEVPFDEWAKLGGGGAQFSYTVTSQNSTTPSQKGFINVKGVPALMPVVNVHEAVNDWLDADGKVAHVQIPLSANLLEEDEVTVTWHATQSDGSVQVLRAKMFRVSSQWVNKVIYIKLDGPHYLKPFDGGYVEVSYEVKRGKRTLASQAIVYHLGYLSASLPAPYADPQLANNLLDPTDSTYQFGLDFAIPAGVEQPSPCTITLFWESDDGGYYEDEQVLQAGDTASHFTVPASELQLKGNAPAEVTVYYTIEWPGKPTQASDDSIFRVATAAMMKSTYPAPVLPQVSGGNLNLAARSDNQLLVQIPHYPGQAVGDEIIVKIGNYSTRTTFVSKVGVQDITLNLAGVLQPNIQAVINSTAAPLSVFYQVIHNGAKQVFYSDVDTVKLSGGLPFEYFEQQAPRYLAKGTSVDFLGVRVTVDHGTAYITPSYCAAWYPTYGNVIFAHRSAQVRFELRSLARSVSFDIADASRVRSVVRFYTAAGTEIQPVITTPDFSVTPAGYTWYSTRVTFTTPNAAIASFRFYDGGGDTYIDNIRYTAF
ncbi:hypothetical protein [Pseudomonas sp. TE50-2]|uniref:hypothetical protein n=1 Tax=Pseudomonas sp. TE50-2 TaxID=3142707 RepID=UPI00346641B8